MINEKQLRINLTRLAASYPKGSSERRRVLALLKEAEFDPEEIADVESGPHEHESDESYMSTFTQDEHSELSGMAEGDGLGKAAWQKLKGADRDLFAGLVRLAHTNKAARGPVLNLLREQGLLTAGEVPEAFKKQWKDKDKDNDGKENEPKPDFLKGIEKGGEKDKKARRAGEVPEAFKKQWDKGDDEDEGKDKKAARNPIARLASQRAASAAEAATLAFKVARQRGEDVTSAKAIGLAAARKVNARSEVWTAKITGRGELSTVPDREDAVDADVYRDGKFVTSVTLLRERGGKGELNTWGSMAHWSSEPVERDDVDSIVMAVRKADKK